MTESERTTDTTQTERFDVREDDTFETTREELQATLEYQIQRLREIDNKAIEILKANLLLFGLVVTGGSILVQSDLPVTFFLNIFILTGVSLLFLSIALAGVTYTSSNLRGGLDTDAIENAIAARHDDRESTAFENQLLRSYGRWIGYNARITAVNDMFATVTVLLVIVAFVYIAAGLVIGIAALGLATTVVIFIGQSAILFWLMRLVYRMDYIGPASPEMEDTFEGVLLSKGATRQDGMTALKEMLKHARRKED